MTELKEMAVKEIVLKNSGVVPLFEKYGIDYCCRGSQKFADACSAKGIEVENFESEIREILDSDIPDEKNMENWDLSRIISFIVNTHHTYIRKMVPQIIPHLEKLQERHGRYHPEIESIKELFETLAGELASHMMKEERILFNLIGYLEHCQKHSEKPKSGGYQSVEQPVAAMVREHEGAGGILEQMRELSNNYNPPEDACTTYRITLNELEDFEKDLHKHIHLENNLLFPKAVELENSLIKKG